MRRFTKIAKRNKLTMGKSLFSMAVIYSASFHYDYLNETVKPTKMVYFEGRASILSVRRVSSPEPKQSPIENTANTSHQMIQQQTENQPAQAKQLYIHVFLQQRSKTFIHLLNNITNADYKVLQTWCWCFEPFTTQIIDVFIQKETPGRINGTWMILRQKNRRASKFLFLTDWWIGCRIGNREQIWLSILIKPMMTR